MTPRVWLDHTFIGVADDVVVVLTLWEVEFRAVEAAAVLEKGPADVQARMIVKCLVAWRLKRTVLVLDGEPPLQALMTAVKLTRKKETVVTGNLQYDSKSKGWLRTHIKRSTPSHH